MAPMMKGVASLFLRPNFAETIAFAIVLCAIIVLVFYGWRTVSLGLRIKSFRSRLQSVEDSELANKLDEMENHVEKDFEFLSHAWKEFCETIIWPEPEMMSRKRELAKKILFRVEDSNENMAEFDEAVMGKETGS